MLNFTDVYRGVILTKSFEEKKEICLSMFTLETLKKAKIELIDDNLHEKPDSSQPRGDESLASVVVKNIMYMDQVIAENEIFITCPGVEQTVSVKKKKGVLPHINFFYASFAFETNVFLLGEEGNNPSEIDMWADFKLTMSPKIGFQHEYQIRDMFLTTRGNIGKCFLENYP